MLELSGVQRKSVTFSVTNLRSITSTIYTIIKISVRSKDNRGYQVGHVFDTHLTINSVLSFTPVVA